MIVSVEKVCRGRKGLQFSANEVIVVFRGVRTMRPESVTKEKLENYYTQ
jgi:hypothetical protein